MNNNLKKCLDAILSIIFVFFMVFLILSLLICVIAGLKWLGDLFNLI